jgi:hypothetical protein
MDLKVFFRKVRETEAKISEPYVVVVSKETADGGRAGVKSEVDRGVAARLIVENRATLANAEDAAAFRSETAQRQRQREETVQRANKMHVAVLPNGSKTK